MSATTNTRTSLEFLAGGGEMGERIRAMNWSKTPLGPVEGWPQSLRSAVSIMLPSKAQIAMFWGEDLITLYNDAYRPAFGGKHPGALGKPVREAWGELWRAGLKELFDGVLATGDAFWAQARPFYMERHGYLEETYFDVSYDPIRDESGRVAGLFCIVSEVTGRVVGERRLRLLRDLRGLTQQALGAMDMYRAAAEVVAGYPEDLPFALLYGVERPGQPPRLVGSCGLDGNVPEMAPAHALELIELEVAALGRATPVHAGPWPEPIKSMALVPFAVPGEPPQGCLVAGLSTRRKLDADYRDFVSLVSATIASAVAAARRSEDERRRAEMLAEIDRAKTAFFSNVSHEFRTPLTLMLGPVEDALADTAAPLPGAHRDRLELARRSARRLQKLVNTLLDFSRIEAGRAQASYEATDLAVVTAEIASNFRSALEKAGLSLEVDCTPLPEPAWVDRDMWEKIVLNLLSNAFKFTFEGSVRVTLRQDGAAIRLAVRDTGTGIPAAEIPHLFERFRRVEGARSRTHEGTGIGLALVQELVKLHGGTVMVESEAGKGSTFCIAIPTGNRHLPADRIGARRTLASTDLGAPAFVDEALRWLPDDTRTDDSMPPAAGARRARIVWADDNADMRDYVRTLLAPFYDVVAVPDGTAALGAIRDQAPDAVLADVMMPGIDGLELVRRLRADPATAAMPVLLLSARAGEESRIEGFDAGADDYLYKPFSARELLTRIARLVRAQDLRAEMRRHADEAERHRRMLDVALEAAGMGTWRYDFVDNAVEYSPRAQALYGLPSPRAVHDDAWTRSLLHPDDLGRMWAALRAACDPARDGRYAVNYRVRDRKDGWRWLSVWGLVEFNAEGCAVSMTGASRDISEQRRVEEALRESERKLQTLIANLPGMAYRCPLESPWPLTFASEGVLALTGQPASAFMNGVVTWAELVHADDVAAVEAEVSAAIAGQRPFEMIYRIRAADGSVHWMLDRGRPVEDRPGEGFVAIEGFVFDVSRQREAEEALREVDRRKDEFLAVLSHELRNPLAPLKNGLVLLREAVNHPATVEAVHAMMERQVDHLVRLVDDLLEVSRISTGALELRREHVEVAAVVASAVEASRPFVDAAGHTLEVAVPGEPLWINGDRVRLAQILSNLLNNAARYTDAGGHIELTVRSEGAHAAFSVKDNGVGISPEAMPGIFRMFNRDPRTRERGPGGLGIGLALARRLAEMHGGSLEAASDGPGRGSVFTLRVALAAAVQPAAKGRRAPEPPPLRRRVLIVDDNHDAAVSLGMLLGHLGAETRVMNSGRDALDHLAAYEPDIVLLDIGMPGMDGYDVARAIRARWPQSRPAIVALTGWGQESDRRRALEAGFDHHLVKPVDAATLHTLLYSLPAAPGGTEHR